MIAILKTPLLLMTLIASMILGLTWLRAQEASPESDASPISKWAAIEGNNKKMLKSLTEIEDNLNFVKARSMSGGKK